MTPDPDALPVRVPTLVAKLTAFVIAVTLMACAPVPQTAINVDREKCYAAADVVTGSEIAAACPGKPWSTCPDRPAILSRGTAREQACK